MFNVNERVLHIASNRLCNVAVVEGDDVIVWFSKDDALPVRVRMSDVTKPSALLLGVMKCD